MAGEARSDGGSVTLNAPLATVVAVQLRKDESKSKSKAIHYAAALDVAGGRQHGAVFHSRRELTATTNDALLTLDIVVIRRNVHAAL